MAKDKLYTQSDVTSEDLDNALEARRTSGRSYPEPTVKKRNTYTQDDINNDLLEGHLKALSATPRPKHKLSDDAPKYKKGGSIRGHGCETKGKTKGRMV